VDFVGDSAPGNAYWPISLIISLLLGTCAISGELSLITPDLWLTYDHFMGKVSALGQPTQPSIPWGW